MLLTHIECDGCGRGPTFWEWVRGEMTTEGYPEWRHPGIPFKKAGLHLPHPRAPRFFHALFGRPIPDELSYLCPQCQEIVLAELPDLLRQDESEAATRTIILDEAAHYFGQ